MIEKKLADMISSTRFKELPGDTVVTTRQSILDITGVTIAGSGRPEIDLLRNTLTHYYRSGRCPVLGTPFLLSGLGAALFNGAASRVLDFDDVVDPLGTHPSVAVFASLLSVAYEMDALPSDADFLTAFAVGHDVCTRLARARKYTLLETGRYDLSKIIGSAAAAANLLQLGFDQTLNALGIAYTSCLGEAQCMVEGAPTVSYQQGLVALNAVSAVGLAAAGYKGANNFLTGRYGLFNAFEPGADVSLVIKDLGSDFAGNSSIAYKPFPTCRPNISAALLAIELMDGTYRSTDDISSISIRVNQQIFDLVCAPAATKWRPQSPVEARFGMAYTVAAALIDGKVSINVYDEDRLSDAKILSLSELVRPAADCSCDIPELGTHGRICVEIDFKDGGHVRGSVDRAKGNPDYPMTASELEEKFKDCMEYRYGNREKGAEVIAAAGNMEKSTSASYLTALIGLSS